MKFNGNFVNSMKHWILIHSLTPKLQLVRTLEITVEKGVFNTRPKHGLQEVCEPLEAICRIVCVR